MQAAGSNETARSSGAKGGSLHGCCSRHSTLRSGKQGNNRILRWAVRAMGAIVGSLGLKRVTSFSPSFILISIDCSHIFWSIVYWRLFNLVVRSLYIPL